MTYTLQDDVYSARKRFSPESSTRPGFASTADYWLKKKRATPTDARLFEVAGFYRSLARTIPGIPTGYKGNGAALPVTRAERWKARAEELHGVPTGAACTFRMRPTTAPSASTS
jgi:hypothetical protein